MYVEREVCMLRIIFMGTPQFAVPALEALSAGTARLIEAARKH